MRRRALHMALLAGLALLPFSASTLAVTPDADRPCLQDDGFQSAQLIRVAASLTPTASAQARKVPADCAAFIAGETTSTSVLTRCLRFMSAASGVTPVALIKATGVPPASGAPRQQAGCRKGTKQRGDKTRLN